MRVHPVAGATLLVLALCGRGAEAQARASITCQASMKQKAVAGRVVDSVTGAPMVGLRAYLKARRPDTTFLAGGGTLITPEFARHVIADTLGRFCFESLAPGDYRFETRAMRLDESHQAVMIRLERDDSLKTITLRYRPWGLSPEEEFSRAERLVELEMNRNQWDLLRPPHYLLRVRRECAFCFGPAPLTYEIVHDRPIAAIDSAGRRRALRDGEDVATIDGVFDALRAALLEEQGFVAAIAYDARLGWPRHYETGTRTMLTDSWAKVTVERFDVVK